eukprot:scaffold2236_cov136-Isochrysis_galbana.AAC.4
MERVGGGPGEAGHPPPPLLCRTIPRAGCFTRPRTCVGREGGPGQTGRVKEGGYMCAPFAGRVVTPVAPQSSAQPVQGPPQHKTRRGRSLACPPVARRARIRSNRKAPGRGGGHRRRQASSAAAHGGLGLGGSISGAGRRVHATQLGLCGLDVWVVVAWRAGWVDCGEAATRRWRAQGSEAGRVAAPARWCV